MAVVPSGGAAVSATIANGGAAVTATVPAADYYLTTAGGVSSITTALQTALNNASNGYPRSTAALANAIGGTWTTGSAWLCDESSGNLAPAVGAVTLTAGSTPTYGTAGPRAGIDFAVGFDSVNDRFDGGDVFDVTGTDDLIVAWVAKVAVAPVGSADTLAVKLSSSGAGWQVSLSDSAGTFVFYGADAASTTQFLITGPSFHVGVWHVGIACIDRSTGKARIGTRSLAGTSSISAETTALTTTMANAIAFRVGDRADAPGTAPTDTKIAYLAVVSGNAVATGLSAGLSAALTTFANAVNSAWTVTPSTTDGRVSIGWTGYATPTWSLSWTSTVLRDALGFTANIAGVTTTQTSTAQSPMVWFPDSPLNCDDHPSMTPEETDLRTSESPTGIVLGLCGNTKYAHSNLRYERVPVDRIREGSVTYANASLEVFFRNTQSGQGDISWFTPASPVQVYWNNAGTDVLLGADANDGAGVAGWTIVGVSSFSKLARPSQTGWVGAFDVTFPRLVSDGS
jgi:hypothetical protein